MTATIEKHYKEINGTSFDARTPDAVAKILDYARNTPRRRLRLFYGDTETGRDWMEEHDTIGYIGRSGGTIKIPLLIANARSMGGGAILDHCIVKITEAKGGRVLYQHPNYHHPKLIVPAEPDSEGRYLVNTDKGTMARFHTYRHACLWAQFMEGKRNSKGIR